MQFLTVGDFASKFEDEYEKYEKMSRLKGRLWVARTCLRAARKFKQLYESVLRRRELHMQKFNCIRKCLALLLDDNLLTMILLRDPIVKELSNSIARGLLPPILEVPVLRRVRETVEAGDLPHNEKTKNINLEEESAKLRDLLHESEDYFDQQEHSVEIIIDRRLKEEATALLGSRKSSGSDYQSTDIVRLICWLDSGIFGQGNDSL